MNRYRILLNVQNVLAELEGRLQKVGFYTTRVIDAATSEEASLLVLALIQQDTKLRQLTRNDTNDPPIFLIEELKEATDCCDEVTNTGFSFYLEE